MVRINKILKIFFVVCFWIFIWWILSLIVKKEIIIPSPYSVFIKLSEFVSRFDFWKICLVSILRIMSGYILGIIFGLFFAILTHAFSVINSLLSPLLVTIRSTPVASFIIILLYILGKESVTVIISFLMTLPIVWDGVRAGMDNSPTKLEEVARIYSLPYLKKLKILYFPYSVSYLFSSAKTALGLGWKSGIAAEVLCTPKVSIGKALYDSKIYLESDSLFAWTIVIITISLFLEEVLKKIIVKFEKVTSI